MWRKISVSKNICIGVESAQVTLKEKSCSREKLQEIPQVIQPWLWKSFGLHLAVFPVLQHNTVFVLSKLGCDNQWWWGVKWIGNYESTKLLKNLKKKKSNIPIQSLKRNVFLFCLLTLCAEKVRGHVQLQSHSPGAGRDSVPLLRGTSAERMFAYSRALTLGPAVEGQILPTHYR